MVKVTDDQIQEAAYYKWQRIGSPLLDEKEQKRLWLEAEEDLLREKGIPYRVLLNEKNLEIRKYYPQKRLIVAAHREYYLQFPYIVFACRKHPTGNYLYVGFAKRDDDTVYFPSIPNMCPQTYGICLARAMGDGHFRQLPTMTLDELIQLFWITEFDPWGYGWEIGHRSLKQNFQGRYNYWRSLSLPEVLSHLSYMPRSFDHFIKKISAHHEDMTMRELISVYDGCEQVVQQNHEHKVVESDDRAPAWGGYYE